MAACSCGRTPHADDCAGRRYLEDHPPSDVVQLVDELLAVLQLRAANGRIELEFRDRRLTKLRRHEEFSRSDLGREEE